MATFDFAPMLRSTIGFDNLPEMLSDALEREASGYPPYNIEKLGSDSYCIVMALAGFARDDIEITQAEGRLTVHGAKKNADEKTYLYRGLAQRPFAQAFDLAEHVEVTGAKLENGLLMISLKRELPETLKPRTIPIDGGAAKPALKQVA